MHVPNRSESTESLSAWSPFKCEQDEYALRYFLSTAAGQRKLPPTLLDRTILDRTFRRLGDNRSTGRQEQEPRCPMSEEPETTVGRYQAENARLKSAIEVCETKLRNKNCEKTDYEVRIGREYKRFEREFDELKCDSVRILNCAGDRQTYDGWLQIADRVQEYLARVRQFFDSQLTYVDSMESEWTLRHRTLALEGLKKMYTRNVSRMDAWIESVVEA